MEVDGEVDSKIKMDQRKKRFLSNCERRTISLICPRSSLLNKKRNGGKNCRILGKNEMISCQSIRRCKSCPKSCRVCRTYSSNARRRWASRRRRMNSSDPALKSSRLKWKTLAKGWRRKPWSKRNWTWRSRACRQEKEGEAATHLGRMGAASTQPSCSNLSRWEQSRQCSKSQLLRESAAKGLRCISQRQSPLSTCPVNKLQDGAEGEWDEEQRK